VLRFPSMGLLLLPLALIAYFLGIFLAIVGSRIRGRGYARMSAALLTVAWGFHLAAIVHAAVETGRFPMANVAEYLLVLSWVILSFHLFLWFRARIQAAGLVLPPLAALLALGALVLPAPTVALPSEHRQGWFIFHTTVATLGMAALCVAFAMSLIYLVQDRALKSKKASRLLDVLPSLETCDRIGYHALLWGFPLLTLGIATGAVWNASVHHTFWIRGAKGVFPALAWVVFALLLYARLVRGFRGRKSAYLTIAGFTLGLLTVLGMTL